MTLKERTATPYARGEVEQMLDDFRGMAISVSRRFKYLPIGLDRDDLIQVGLTAAWILNEQELEDPTTLRGAFSTLVWFRMHSAMYREINNMRWEKSRSVDGKSHTGKLIEGREMLPRDMRSDVLSNKDGSFEAIEDLQVSDDESDVIVEDFLKLLTPKERDLIRSLMRGDTGTSVALRWNYHYVSWQGWLVKIREKWLAYARDLEPKIAPEGQRALRRTLEALVARCETDETLRVG